ncbi:unnamed protein product [Rotaria sp. Silwood1]|nr:unnamed protein product [Rotaria sp. Silwood1]
MLQHLSTTSPYVCDLSRGPIEPANRMASTPTNKINVLLEQKESFSKTRTPLKLLGPDEIPIDITITTNDINASLQPVWYTEQTIVDDHHVQQEDNTSTIQEKSRTTLTRATLPPKQSESPSISEDDELPSNQPSLMHKSLTFTIEPSINVDSQSDDLEKENLNTDDNKPSIAAAPSDESFRALEHLLGLGSSTTIRESPKPNHDTLSLTVVTPTDIINSTTTSLRMSYAPKTTTDNLPLSQDIPIMPIIESINSTNPPSFLMDNTANEEEQASTTINQQDSFDNIENKTNTDDETDFSFELNDFSNNSKPESIVNVPEPPSQPMITIRAPTCADVAYRALIKPRSSARISQPVKVDSPLATSIKPRSSAPASRILRSSCRRISTDSSSQNSIVQGNYSIKQSPANNECFVNNENGTNTEKQNEFVEIVSVLEEDENEQEKTNSITLNLTSSKSTDEINQNMSNQMEQISTPIKSLMPLLSREYTYNTPKRRQSQRRRSMLNSSSNSSMLTDQTTINEEESKSPTIPSKSMLNILLTNTTETEQKSLTNIQTLSPVQSTTKSPSVTSKSMLGILLTNPTDIEQSVLQETSIRPLNRVSTRKSKRLSTNLTPRVSINPLHSSTPSTTKRHKSLQMVSIGEQEQVLTTVPQHINNDDQEIEIIPLNKTEESIQQPKTPRTIDTSVQTTPSLNTSSRRYLNTIEQQTTPIVQINKSKSSIIIHEQQQQQISSMQTEMVMSLQRNVRFQLTPTTDARLVEKEKLEETLRGLKPDIIINPIPIITLPKQETVKSVKSIRTKKNSKANKKVVTMKKKKVISNKKSQVKKPLKRLSPTKVLKKKPESTRTKKRSQRKRLNLEVTIEPAAKRTKTSKPIQIPLPSLTPPKTRTALTNNKKHKSESVERHAKPPTVPKTNKQNKSEQKRRASKNNKTELVKQEQPKALTNNNTNKRELMKRQRSTSAKNKAQSSASEHNKPEPIKQKRNAMKKNASELSTREKKKPEPIEQKQHISEKNKAEPVKQTRSASKQKKSEASASENKPKPIEQKRRASKKNTTASSSLEKSKSEPVKLTRAASKNKKSEPIERPVEITVEPKITELIIKTRKRRLESVEKNEASKKKVEIQNIEVNQDERQKMEELTVAELKSRLNKHKEDIPKRAKKADLIALLMKIETNLLKERKEVEAPIVKINGNSWFKEDQNEMDTSSYTGLPNKLFQGLTSVKSTLTTGHILEKSEKTFIEKNDRFHHHMARSVLGIQAPLKLQTELQIANKLGRLPCLPSSRLMVDVLRGTNEDISFDDILNNPYEFGERQVDPHLAMDKQDQLF